jgi:hypothetical protein
MVSVPKEAMMPRQCASSTGENIRPGTLDADCIGIKPGHSTSRLFTIGGVALVESACD